MIAIRTGELQIIDLLVGLIRGAAFRHDEVPGNSPLALMGRFPFLMGRFLTLMGRFRTCLNGPFSLQNSPLRKGPLRGEPQVAIQDVKVPIDFIECLSGLLMQRVLGGGDQLDFRLSSAPGPFFNAPPSSVFFLKTCHACQLLVDPVKAMVDMIFLCHLGFGTNLP